MSDASVNLVATLTVLYGFIAIALAVYLPIDRFVFGYTRSKFAQLALGFLQGAGCAAFGLFLLGTLAIVIGAQR